jgi:thiol-disulfide isomerase/thioredoxin
MIDVRKAILATLLALLCACSSARGGSGVARVGHVAPQWTDPNSSGGIFSSNSLRGKPVYLNFFATWCPPCNEEAPYINAMQKQYAAQGLRVVGIDELESAKKAQQFAHKYTLVYPTVVDQGTLQTLYGVNGLPVHVFIDRSGVVRKIVAGEMSKSDITAAIRAIL